MSAEWVAIGVGTLSLTVAVAWCLGSRSLVRTRLAAALRDGDPRVRAAAVRVAVEQGLRTHDRLLAARIDVEDDPSVLAALVEGVLRNAWEPADRPAILRLRLWAHAERARIATAPVADPPEALLTVRLPCVPDRLPVRARTEAPDRTDTTQALPAVPRPGYRVRPAGVPPVGATFVPAAPRHRAPAPPTHDRPQVTAT